MTVSNDSTGDGNEEPKFKRQRTALACHSCRRRKTKCNGVRPACAVCISMGFECSYPSTTRTSSASNNDPEYGSHVEERLASLEGLLKTLTSPTADPPGSHRHWMARGQLVLEAETRPKSPERLGQSVVNGQAPHPGVSFESAPNNGIEDDTVDGMGVITFVDEFTSGHFGPTSNPALLNKMREALSLTQQKFVTKHDDGIAANYISRPASPGPGAMVSEKLTLPPSVEQPNIFGLPSTRVIMELVDRFFSGTGMLFPYIYKKSVYDEIAKLRPPSFGGVRRSWLCLLNAIMALAIALTPTEDKRRERFAKADTFLQRALKLLPDVALQPANIEILQALLLLTQYLQGTQRSTQTYNFQGLTVRVAFQLGLHCTEGKSNDNLLDREVKRRCWYMTYILDKTCSMTYGRPPCIRNEYLSSTKLLEVDLEALESPQSTDLQLTTTPEISTTSCFIRSAELYMIIGDIIDNIYSMNVPRDINPDSHLLLSKVISLENKLEAWKLVLPYDLRLRTRDEILQHWSETSDLFRLSLVLTLRYLNARTLLHRAVLMQFLDKGRTGDGLDKDMVVFSNSVEKISLNVGVSSSIEMIEIHVVMLNSCQQMLTTWWFSVYYVFNSALVILAAVIIQRTRNVQIQALQAVDINSTLNNALVALESLGHESRLALRCSNYLKKLMHSVMSLGNEPDYMQDFLPVTGQDFDVCSLPMSDLSDGFQMGLDMGPFMTGMDFDSFL